MSSFNAFGFFALAGGTRIATTVPGAAYAKHHVHYTTSLKTLENSYVAATLRVYSGVGDAPLPDNTIAFVVAKVFVPNGQPVELDALSFAAIPGDVDGANYQDQIPDCPVYLYGVGHIPDHHAPQVLNDGARIFTVCLSDYIAGGLKDSTVQCMYPATKRWVKTPIPHPQSCTQFFGHCTGFGDTGLLRISVEHVTLSLGPHILAQPAATASTTTTPARRQKYIAYGSTPTQSSSASTPLASTSHAGPSSSSPMQ
ncbi:hypothetical protein B0H17DRAFT_1088843 [Mycena rosella]|uniref:Uncharacterized protein n=1 Tax=Mycena rosella TaxID=1033263 RepID=A0AAD7FI29_MYCRO|nr:hypothetical protein B0H17DRAFT_1113814 [Mycena rosella]KAJ7667326.1 hypothetical protein B0H17DRAFT_1088843 [Mycena rosella]